MNYRSLFLVLLTVLVVGCSAPEPTPTPSVPDGAIAPSGPYWPTTSWRTTTPEQQGVDPALLNQMFQAIDEQRIAIHAVLVVRNGYIVAERYAPPYDVEKRHEQFSVTKSVVATLIGIAIEEGRIPGIETPIPELLPERDVLRSDQQKREITLENLLTMTAGLAWSEGDPAYARMYRSSDWVGSVLGLPIAEAPGTRFNYCSGCSHLLAASLDRADGPRLEAYAQEKLFGPLGIRHFVWETDSNGIPIGGWGLWLTPREMAKLGYLYLHDGYWDGQQVVPSDWVRTSTARHVATDSELGYGYQWWAYPRYGAYLARGRGGQLIVVVPERALVVVFTADVGDDQVLFDLIEEYIIPAAPALPIAQ